MRSTRLLAVTAGAVGVLLSATSAGAATPGASGLGDPYYPDLRQRRVRRLALRPPAEIPAGHRQLEGTAT